MQPILLPLVSSSADPDTRSLERPCPPSLTPSRCPLLRTGRYLWDRGTCIGYCYWNCWKHCEALLSRAVKMGWVTIGNTASVNTITHNSGNNQVACIRCICKCASAPLILRRFRHLIGVFLPHGPVPLIWYDSYSSTPLYFYCSICHSLRYVPSIKVRTLTPYVSSSHTPAPARIESSAHSSRLGVALSEIELLLPLLDLEDTRERESELGRVSETERAQV